MSDVPGLAAALAALVCLALAWWRQQPISAGDRRLDAAHLGASGRMIVLGALLAAFSVGFRSQNAMITVPFLLLVLIDRIGRGVAGALIGATVAFAVGTLIWAVPLVAASGGLESYLAALGAQAGEDFAGVEMLYLNPSPRVAANALLRTMVYPWDSLALGTIVLALAAAGAGVLAVRDRRTLAALIAISVPYLTFHLLFHDMDFVRYALPIVPGVAFLAVCGLERIARRGALPVSGALALWSVAVASPTLFAYSAEPSPITRALGAMTVENTTTRARGAWTASNISAPSRSRGGPDSPATALAPPAGVARTGSLLARGEHRAGLVSRRSASNRPCTRRSEKSRRSAGFRVAFFVPL